jgi:uncharacterized membrane protein YagU involved in acid resistance
MKLNMPKLFATTVALWLFTSLFIWLTCGNSFSWIYTIAPTDAWLTQTEMMTGPNMLASNLITFLRSLIFILVYIWLYKAMPGKPLAKGANYGFMVWFIGAFTGFAAMPFYMKINHVVIIYWIIQALVLNVILGLITASLYKIKGK